MIRSLVLAAALPVLSPPSFAQTACEVDLNGDGTVGGADLAMVLSDWGACNGCTGDLSGDEMVDGVDLAIVLSRWAGTCAVPAWATIVEASPDPTIVTDPALRAAINVTGRAWMIRERETGIEMVLVPPGSYAMGCSVADLNGCLSREHPIHDATITQPFYMSRTEVTQTQWELVMGSNPSTFQAPRYSSSNQRPVESVNWGDIQAFLSATGFRLPTEAEWEYACRGGTTTAFHGCASFPNGTNSSALLGTIAWFQSNSGSGPDYGTHPVGTRLANGLGLYDMLGNVWEVTADWYSETYYFESPATDPQGPTSGLYKVIRGGSYYEGPSTFHHRTSCRFPRELQDTGSATGFRVARNP